MTQRFLPCDRDQQYLMPASLRDWLPEDHLTWFVLDAVSQLDLTAFYARYREDGWGRKAYEPSMMVALVLYAYCEGERSSRQIERRCREDIAFRVLTANQQPDHATICRFRRQHEQALAGLFTGVLGLCAEAGLLRVGVVALDGAKLRANASRERNRTDAELEAEVRRILAEAERVDAGENARFGDARGDELPAGFRDREERLQRLREARERLAARERERAGGLRGTPQEPRAAGPARAPPEAAAARPGAKVNVTDPDSRVVRDYHGYFQGYNVQAVTSSEQIIVAAELSRQATDMHELQPMIEATNRNLQAAHCGPPRVLLADAGYHSEANVRQAEGSGPELLLATRSDRNRRARAAPPRGRIPAGLSVCGRMDRKLATQRGRRLYEQRRWMIEPVFGDIKENRAIRRFMRRGIVACASEWKLIAATHNLKKLYRRARPSPRPANSNPRRGDRATAAAAA